MYDLSELLHLLNVKIPVTVDVETLEIVVLQEAIQAAIDYIAEISEKFSDAFAYFVQELEEYLETVRYEEEPEDDETLGGYHCPCNRQLPSGHRIPWYTSGFQ